MNYPVPPECGYPCICAETLAHENAILKNLLQSYLKLVDEVLEIPCELHADLETGSHFQNNDAAIAFGERHRILIDHLNKIVGMASRIEDEINERGMRCTPPPQKPWNQSDSCSTST